MPHSPMPGLALPSAAYLLGLVVFGLVGWVAYRRGKKTGRVPLLWLGLGTMLYPYVISQTWLLWAIGSAVTGWIWFEWI